MKNILKITLISLSLNIPIFASMNDDPLLSKVTIDKLEYQFNDEKSKSWDVNIWVGYDLNKLYLYTEGEKTINGSASENQLVFSHAVAPFWDIQYGIEFDTYYNNRKNWGVISLYGLAPYFFETKLSLLFDNTGALGLKINFEYETLLTQKLILTSSLEADLYSKNIKNIGIGKGLSKVSAGFRLRYEIKREFTPYIGIEKVKTFSNTYKYNPINETYLTTGVRIWF